jgi:glutamyl-tRNA synthetase
MRTSHVMRGEEWIPSTPKHVLLYRAFGWEMPAFAHLPILRNADRSKISKRRNPWAILPWFRDQGYLPEALLNFLALMGFSIPGDPDPSETREVFPFDELVRHFGFERFSTTSPVFDLAKLDWLNGVYIRALPLDDLGRRARPYLEAAGYQVDGRADYLLRCLALEQERLKKLAEAPEALSFFLRDELDYATELLIPKGWSAEQSREALDASLALMDGGGDVDAGALEHAARALAAERRWKTGPYFMLLRVAVTGRTASPGLFDTIAVLGRERVVLRLRDAWDRLTESPGQTP